MDLRPAQRSTNNTVIFGGAIFAKSPLRSNFGGSNFRGNSIAHRLRVLMDGKNHRSKFS